jgi:hypothetical protein
MKGMLMMMMYSLTHSTRAHNAGPAKHTMGQEGKLTRVGCGFHTSHPATCPISWLKGASQANDTMGGTLCASERSEH